MNMIDHVMYYAVFNEFSLAHFQPEELEENVLADNVAGRHEDQSEDSVEQSQLSVLFVRPSEVLHVWILRLLLDLVHEVIDALLVGILHHFDSEDVMHLIGAIHHHPVLHPLRLSGQIDVLNEGWNIFFLPKCR